VPGNHICRRHCCCGRRSFSFNSMTAQLGETRQPEKNCLPNARKSWRF
jgi:hypothetical protein